MYQPSTQFPQITNRESWTQLVGVYDDSTGDAINLSNSSGQGTFSNWSVQTSASLYGTAIVSAVSVTPLTIGNGTFAAVLPAGLSISPGQYVTFISQLDTTQWMRGQVNSYNAATGAISFAVATVSIQLEIRRVDRDGYQGSGYGPNYSLGSYDWGQPILTASIGNGISIVDIGIFQVYFSETQFRSLGAGMYSVNATIKSADGIDVRQLFLGRLPVFNGGVTN